MGKSYDRLDNKSRMSREAHVRFCEGLGVKFPRATRPPDLSSISADRTTENHDE